MQFHCMSYPVLLVTIFLSVTSNEQLFSLTVLCVHVIFSETVTHSPPADCPYKPMLAYITGNYII